MKMKNQAVRSLSTQQLKELADLAYPRASGAGVAAPEPKASPPEMPVRQNGVNSPPLAAASIWELKDRADALREKGRERKPKAARKPEGEATRRRKGPYPFERLARWLLHKPKQKPALRQPRASKSASENGQIPAARAVPPAPAAPEADPGIHAAATRAVGETILGTVTLHDVLKELERRGVHYRPPVDDRGVLTIEGSDLVPAKNGKPAKLRPGIGKYLKGHPGEIAGIQVNATQLVDLGSVRLPHGFIESAGPVRASHLEVKQLHSVGGVTVEEFLHAREIQAHGDVTAREILTNQCTVYGNVTCAETLKFTAGSTGTKQAIRGNVRCGHLVSEDDRLVNVDGAVAVQGNCNAPRLKARDLTVGWELQNAKRLEVTGKANLTKLAPSIDAQAEFQGIALQGYVQQLRDLREEGVRKKVRASAENGAPSTAWTAEGQSTQAHENQFEPGQARAGTTRSRQGRNGAKANGNTQGVGL